MPLYLFHKLPPAGIFANNPVFSTVLPQSAPAVGALATLATDLTGGKELAELTSSMILTNILHRLRLDSHKTYTVIKVVGPCLILAGGIYEFSKRLVFVADFVGAVSSKMASYFTASIKIPANHPLNKDVLAWLAAQGGQSARSLTVDSGQIYNEDGDEANEGELDAESEDCNKHPVQYIPGFGKTSFRFGRHRMTMERKEAKGFYNGKKYTKVEEGDMDPSENQIITLTCFPTFSGTQPLKDFLNNVRGFSNPAHDAMLQVWAPSGPNGSYWDCNDRPARKLAGVVMEKAKKDALVSDIDYYLSSACKKYYQNRGIPYRRGYLAFGPPGTGKTSVALALASHFKLPIFLLGMSDPGLNDKTLEGLFATLPRRCILLLEDVDSAGLQREKMSEAADSNSSKKAKKGKSSAKKSLTLSGLLNALDGPASVDGRILFMTSNSPDTLDAALVRPGRCDVKILLGYATPEVIETMFSRIYTTSADETADQGENFADSMDIPAMAAKFASKIPLEAPITPAEIQAWLLVNRLNPKGANEGAAEWAQEIVDNKKRGANVASFANEIDKDASSTMYPSPTSSPSHSTTRSDNESDNESENDSDNGSDNDSEEESDD